jgi:hypothetical protein
MPVASIGGLAALAHEIFQWNSPGAFADGAKAMPGLYFFAVRRGL